MLNPIDKILTEWAYRVHNGMPDPANNYHLVQLEQYLNELRLPRKVVKKVLEKVRTYVDNDYNKSVDRVGKPYGSVKGEPSKDDKKGEEEPKKDVKVEMTDVDVDGTDFDHRTARKEVYPVIEKSAEAIKTLMGAGKKEEAQLIAKKLVKKYKLTRPLYLQPDKEGMGKIYVGGNHRYAWGTKNEGNKTQGALIDVIESSGVSIPVRAGGISRTALSPQQVHTKRKIGKVKPIKGADGKVIAKEVVIGKRKFTLKADPTDTLSQMKLNNLPDGEVEFCDINSADTPEGRTECVMNATNNLGTMFSKIQNHLSEDDKFNREVAENVKRGLIELQQLEKAKNNAKTDSDRKALQGRFFDKCMDVMVETKNTNPDGTNEFVNMTAYVAETVEAIVDLNRGIETYIPSSGNFKTSDVLSLEDGSPKSTAVTMNGRSTVDEFTIKGTSVKFAGGGASQMPNKIENSTFNDKETKIGVGGKERTGTKEILNGITEYYDKFFPGDKKTPTPIKEEELKAMYDDNLNALYEFYPQFKNNSNITKEALERCENAAEKQLKRLNKKYADKGEGYENALNRFKAYHFNQWVATMVHNHPERGLKKQAFSNSDYVVGSQKGKKYIKRVHSDGIDSVVWAGWDPDQGYAVSKDTGYIYPTNVYSSRMKHSNPADYWLKKVK
jgi:hypothetical protein